MIVASETGSGFGLVIVIVYPSCEPAIAVELSAVFEVTSGS